VHLQVKMVLKREHKIRIRSAIAKSNKQ